MATGLSLILMLNTLLLAVVAQETQGRLVVVAQEVSEQEVLMRFRYQLVIRLL
jgi:hypothetical protein